VTPDARRFSFCILASLLINALALLLAGWLWRPQPVPALVMYSRIKLVTLARRPLPHPPRISPPVLPPPPTPLKPVIVKSRPVKPPRPKKMRRPGARVRSTQPAAPAAPAGGTAAGAPAPALAAPAAVPAPHIVAQKRPAVRVVHNSVSPPVLTPSPSPASVPVPAPPVPAAISAPITGRGAGGGSEGRGPGSESGTGKGSGAGSGTSRDAGEPFGIGKGMAGDGAPRHVVYILDISGSMSSRIDRAEQELRRALNGLRPDETFNIVVFSDEARSFDSGMAPATPDLVRRATDFLDSLRVDGGTNLESALMRALTLPDVNEVVLLTDGVPTVGETDFGTLARRVRRLNRNHARISAVGMVGKNPDGTDNSFEAAQLLQQIARDSGGTSKVVTLGVATP